MLTSSGLQLGASAPGLAGPLRLGGPVESSLLGAFLVTELLDAVGALSSAERRPSAVDAECQVSTLAGVEREAVFAVLKLAAARVLEVDPVTVVDSSRFMEDFDADSLDMVEIMMLVEDELEIELSEKELCRTETVGDVVDIVLATVQGGSGVVPPREAETNDLLEWWQEPDERNSWTELGLNRAPGLTTSSLRGESTPTRLTNESQPAPPSCDAFMTEDATSVHPSEQVTEKFTDARLGDLHATPAWDSSAPILGWDSATGEVLTWAAAGLRAGLPNGHVEIWGSSGAGKTQFTMALLAQIADTSGARFGIADFKNDYGGDFARLVGATFLDMWEDGAPYNPLALVDDSQRTADKTIIELRDTVAVAARSFTRMGHRQLSKLHSVFELAYEGRSEGHWPTLMDVNDLLDADLAGVIGDLTRHQIFGDGPPLGDVVYEDVVFGLSEIPGNGFTTVLAAGFILSALLLKIQGMSPVANTIRYVIVVDEAHRVADFRAIDMMVREGRSKGLAVMLATQQPGDLPDVVATNAQTKICFRLPDAVVAAAAARRLDPNDAYLSEKIRTLKVGEAFVSLGGDAPRLLTMMQFWRDRSTLGLPA